MKKKFKAWLLSGLMAVTCLTSAVMIASQVKADTATRQATTQTETTERIAVKSLFSGSDKVTLTTNQDTPSYVMTNPRNGVLVNSVEGGTVTYLKQINLNDNTKEDLLAEIQITPATTSNYEMEQVILRFEDAVNPKVYIEISLHRYTYEAAGSINQKVFSNVTVLTNTISAYKGWSYDSENIGTNEEPNYKVTSKVASEQDVRHGTFVSVPFYGAATKGTLRDSSLKLFYDNETKCIYAGPVEDWSGALKEQGYCEGEYNKIKVLDLDSEDMGPTQASHWTGWTNGMVNVSIKTNSVADTANYMILGIDGQTFDGEYLNDKTPPVLTVNVDEDNLPYGIVGKNYKFFSATAHDAMYDDNTYITTEVLKDGKVLQSTQKGFVPTEAGEYTLRYYAYDFVGNYLYKDYLIEVKEQAPPTLISLSEMSLLRGALALENEDTVYQVEKYQDVLLPIMNISGTSGDAECQVEVTFNGKKIDTQDNIFKAMYEGVYLVKYIFTDALDTTYMYTYRIQSTYSGKAIIADPAINSYMLHGATYKLPKVESSLYNAYGGKDNAVTKILVYNNDTNVLISEYDGAEDVKFTPNMSTGGNLKIVYQATNGTVTQSVEKFVTVLKNESLLDRLVFHGNITATVIEKEYKTVLNTTEEGSGFSIVNPVLYEEFSLNFGIPEAKNQFASLDFYLSDTENSMQTVMLSLRKAASPLVTKSDIYVNGKKIGECAGNFYETAGDDFILEFKNGNEVYDNKGNKIGEISETVYGDRFTGFDSKFMNVSVSFRGVVGESEIVLKNFNNQMMGKFSTDEDFTKPSLQVDGDITLKTEIGGNIEIPVFYAFDVFDSYLDVKVVLEKEIETKAENSSISTIEREKVLEASFSFNKTQALTYKPYESGKYLLTVTATDSSGNKMSYEGGVVIMVGDYSAPIIKIDGEIPAMVSVGKAITLPKATAMDVVDGEITPVAYMVNPDASIIKLDQNKFTLVSKGMYMIFFYAEDKSGNFVMSEYYTVLVQ